MEMEGSKRAAREQSDFRSEAWRKRRDLLGSKRYGMGFFLKEDLDSRHSLRRCARCGGRLSQSSLFIRGLFG